MPKIQTNNIELYYEIHGAGQTPRLDLGSWVFQLAMAQDGSVVAEKFKVIIFDNRGVGQSDKPAGPYTAQMLAQDTVGLLDALNIEKAVIVGHSMGGFIAQALALDFPQRVEKLILCSTNFGGPYRCSGHARGDEVLSDVSSDALTRFKNGLAVSTAPGWSGNQR